MKFGTMIIYRYTDLSMLTVCDDHVGENTSITQFGKLCSICMNYLVHIRRSMACLGYSVCNAHEIFYGGYSSFIRYDAICEQCEW